MQRLLAFGVWMLVSSYCFAETFGDWEYVVENGEAIITGYIGSGGDVEIPNEINGVSVKQIGKEWLSGVYPWPPIFGMNNTTVTTVTIPSSVTQINHGAISYCQNLSSVVLGTNVVKVQDYAFQQNYNLTNVFMSPNLQSIGLGAFHSCLKLNNVNLPNSVLSIQPFAFVNCTNITTINIPSSLTNLETGVFQGCTSLTNVTASNGLKRVNNFAFYGCTGLITITLPQSIEHIGANAFAQSVNLARVEFLGNQPTFDDAPFGNTTATIYYLSTAFGWSSTFAGRPTEPLDSYRLFIFWDALRGELVQPINYNTNSSVFGIGEIVTVQITPRPGFLFQNFSGDIASGSESVNVLMDSNKTITASFSNDLRDADGDGLPNYDEIIVHGTNPNAADSNDDGINDGDAVSLNYDPKLSFSPLVAFVKTNSAIGNQLGLYTTNQIYNLGLGGIILSRGTNNELTLNYQIVESTNLVTWTTNSFQMPITNAPTNKMFLRVQAVGQ